MITPQLSNWHRAAKRFALVAMLATATAAASAQPWRCETPSGIVYADRPCPVGTVASGRVEADVNVVKSGPAVQQRAARAQAKSPSDLASRSETKTVKSQRPNAKGHAASAVTKPKPKRDPRAVVAFRKLKPCPATGRKKGACPGYEIDHVVPLAAGGADAPHNMQWLTRKQHREKTRSERQTCVYGCRP